ncbi:MAG: hypothetical protein ABIV21_06385 [Pyrinomonadaceae bacterium]
MAARWRLIIAAVCSIFLAASCTGPKEHGYNFVGTVAGTKGEFGEPFGVAVHESDVYVSDGEAGKIWRISDGAVTAFAEGLDTPSAIAFDKAGNLIVADTGANTIRSVDTKGAVSTIAGTGGRAGFADGDAAAALFNAPIGLAVDEGGRIFVADTYNDRIRVIENGQVRTLAGGGVRGFADGAGQAARFDTPCGVAVWQDKLVVADTVNRRVRVVEPDGRVWTLAGDGVEGDLKDGSPVAARFVEPTAVAVDKQGGIFIADGNAIRRIGGGVFPYVTTISDQRRGVRDGQAKRSRFNRPAGLAFDDDGQMFVTDSENRLVRRFADDKATAEITAEQVNAMRDTPEGFRRLQPARWPYDPPDAVRDIAGTLGELRGEVGGKEQLRFHNGLDIAGAYGETARFIRDEKVLDPVSAINFGSLRELLRMPTIGYIHIRLGRNADGALLPGDRFQFTRDSSGKLTDVRVPRGAKFKAGEPVGTLNAMNHVHLIAGRSGSEMNALDALIFPGLVDSRPPVIEKVTLFDENWRQFETAAADQRIKLSGKAHIVVRAFDQTDGNSERRRLGVYKLGYQVKGRDGTVEADTKWTISFDRLGPSESVPMVYAAGSKSGATGETIFNYIVTNFVHGDDFHEDVFDTAELGTGIHTLRIFAADYSGNTTSRDVTIEVLK